jgi:regulator of replication initiation timing
MNQTEKHLTRISEKLQTLLRDHAALKKENQQLREALQNCRESGKEHQKTIEELKQHVSILKVTTNEMSEADKRDFEKRINGYLKELDRCIALLGQ